jgi:hypothetical protein
MNKKHRVRLTAEEREEAQAIKNNMRNSKTRRNRSDVLLLADESIGKPITHENIALRLGVTVRVVSKIAKEYCEKGFEETMKIQCRTEPPRPSIVTGEIEARIIATACGEPPKGYARWTVRLLTEKVLELKILEKGSRETVRRTLKKRNLSLT